MAFRLAILLGFALLSAGCAAPTADLPAVAHAAPAPDQPPAPVVHRNNGTMPPAPVSWLGGFSTPSGKLVFDAPPEAVALVLELAWHDPLQDLDMHIVAPRGCHGDPRPADLQEGLLRMAACFPETVAPSGTDGVWKADGGGLGAGDSPIRFVVGESELRQFGCRSTDERCTWHLFASADVAHGELRVQWAATVFFEPPPPGYRLLG
ncbi:MAG TPA: hypothetical protein VFH47_03340 [Candidatus Thermoplasmatota archaeon]|nr:hypothetical protein [Candidatus Thermoplasmatota archaeon]